MPPRRRKRRKRRRRRRPSSATLLDCQYIPKEIYFKFPERGRKERRKEKDSKK